MHVLVGREDTSQGLVSWEGIPFRTHWSREGIVDALIMFMLVPQLIVLLSIVAQGTFAIMSSIVSSS